MDTDNVVSGIQGAVGGAVVGGGVGMGAIAAGNDGSALPFTTGGGAVGGGLLGSGAIGGYITIITIGFLVCLVVIMLVLSYSEISD